MAAKMKAASRGPSVRIAKSRAKVRKTRHLARDQAAAVEAKSRKCGGYGRRIVRVTDIPPGGMKKSPAYRLLVSRNGGVTPPPPEERAGAPVKGGVAVNKLPANVLVDVQRRHWVPDDWGQVIKNTGPGGTYIIWVSPEGKFFYHHKGYPSAMEETLGRELTAKDGFNGILRSAKQSVKPDADKNFLRDCLSREERKHIVPAEQFHFGIVSARRATYDQGICDIMVVEALFQVTGVKPTWYVDAESFEAYKKLGLKVKVGGKLTPARNMVLADAKRLGKRCCQVSDDISKWEYLDVAKQDFRGEVNFAKANAALQGSRRHVITPLAAAQFILAKMRSSPLKPQLGGVFPTSNASMTLGTEEFKHEHFILGDFFVVDASPCRFDTTITLKEDYDFTCSHLKKHGSVLRCQRLFVHAKHIKNKGGAVATRDGNGKKERMNIAILQKKWPGVFKVNKKRKDEVLMRWSSRDGKNTKM